MAIKSYIIPFWINGDKVSILMGVVREVPNNPKIQPYTYSFLGGTCENGETPEKCLIRELFEETTGYMHLTPKDLNPKNTLQFKYPYKNGYIQIYAIPIENIDEISTTVNYYHGQNKEFKPEFLEYHFIESVPLEGLLQLPKIYPNTYKHQAIDKRKHWKEYVEEYHKLTNKKRGIWYLSDAILRQMLKHITKINKKNTTKLI